MVHDFLTPGSKFQYPKHQSQIQRQPVAFFFFHFKFMQLLRMIYVLNDDVLLCNTGIFGNIKKTYMLSTLVLATLLPQFSLHIQLLSRTD
jgi:hypothetical protein